MAMLSMGCQTLDPFTQSQPPLPSYGELATRYNRHVHALDRLWSRATIVMKWTDKKGKHHHAQADNSTLMIVGRDHLALSIGKSVKDLLWIGCDSMRYWWIELDDESVAYIGWHDKLYAGQSDPLPVDIRPLDLPVLLGLIPLDPDKLPTQKPYVTRYQGHYIISPPGTNARITLESKTALPIKIEMFDRRGKLEITSMLSKPGRVKLHNRSPGDWSTIMTRALLIIAGRSAEMSIDLNSMTDARADDETRKDRALQHAFDYDKLKSALRVTKQVSLDK
jgi:hypothetical protein